ncbi:MAG: 50S ribosomal protein L18 [Ignavibacteriaceae bacterium]|nr:50S ribosomal protein L18 [Ignavibacteriaceae bacterium]
MYVKKANRERSKTKIRKKISGTAVRPRLTVYRSLGKIYGQMIDDVTGNTLVSVSDLTKDLAETLKLTKGKIAKSKVVGKHLAKLALEKNITSAVFDRNGYRYHGRVQALAESAREGGLKL